MSMRQFEWPGSTDSKNAPPVKLEHSQEGPFAYSAFHYPLIIPGDTKRGRVLRAQTLQLTITVPIKHQDAVDCLQQIPSEASESLRELQVQVQDQPACSSLPNQPFPLVILFNGFLIPSAWYRLYSEILASWGYAVLQYDVKSVGLVTDLTEVGPQSARR